MEIVRKLDNEKAIKVMGERGYSHVSTSGDGESLFFSKFTDLNACLHASVSIPKMSMTLEMIELKFCCAIRQENFDFFHKDFETFEKVIYLYSAACITMGPVAEHAAKMGRIEKAIPGQSPSKDLIKDINKKIKTGEEKEPKPAEVPVKERKKEFWLKVAQVCKEKEYPRELAEEFFRYWTALNDKQTKMLFELEKQKKRGVFDIPGRLVTWVRNDKNWTKKLNTTYENKIKQQNDALKKGNEGIIDPKEVF